MKIRSVGIDLGKTPFTLSRWSCRQGSRSEEVHTEAVLTCRPNPVREAVCEVQQRLRGRRAIAEAVERKNMRFIPIKIDDQPDLQANTAIPRRIRLVQACHKSGASADAEAPLAQREVNEPQLQSGGG
jgi:hypothetical protein